MRMKSVSVTLTCIVFLSLVLFGCEACRRPVSQPIAPPVTGELRVPLNFATIGDAFRHAKKGDYVLVAPGTYSPATGEVFPLQQPDEVYLKPDTWNAKVVLECPRATTVTPFVSSLLVMGQEAKVEGITFAGDGVSSAIESKGVRNLNIHGCTFHTSFGIRLDGGKGVFIQNNLFHWKGPATWNGVKATGGDYAIIVSSGEYNIHNNTIAYYMTGVSAAGSILDMRDNIIGPTTYAGVALDHATIANGTDLIIRNDVHSYGAFDWFQWLSRAWGGALVLPQSPYDVNYNFDPIFVDRDGDFRIKDTSQAATVGKIAPRFGGSPSNAPIGAFPPVAYKTDLTFALAPASPSGLQAKGTTTSLTQVLRWSVMADSAGDVTIKPGHRMSIKLFSPFAGQQAPIQSSSIILLNASKNTTLFNQQGSFSLAVPGDPITLDVMYPDTIAAGTSEDYVLIVDTSNAPTGSSLQFVIDRFDWSDGTLPRINDGRQNTKVNGHVLSF